MNGTEILRIVDAIHRDKAIDAEIVFEGIEQAILSAARKHFSEEEQLEVRKWPTWGLIFDLNQTRLGLLN